MKRLLRAAAVLCLSMAGALALLLMDVDVAAGAPITLYLRQVLESLAGGPVLHALVFALLVWLNARFMVRPFAWRRGDRLKLTLLAAVFAAIATASVDGSTADTFLTPAHALLLCAKALGFFAMFWAGMKALLLSLPQLANALRPQPAPAARAVRRGFLLAWGLITVAWLPAVLARWPGALTGDGGRVLQQYFGEIIVTSDHPLAYTWLTGMLASVGRLLGSDNAGLFLCTLVQWLGLSAAMAWVAASLHREGFPKAARFAVVAVSALSPLAMGSAAVIIKDVPYSAAFVAFTVSFSRAALHPREAMGTWKWRVQYAALALCVLLLRHNGIVSVLPASLYLLVRFVRAGRRGRAFTAAALAAPLAVLWLFNSLVVANVAFHVDSTPDLLGVPIQQTARILRSYPAEATPARMATIDRVLEADALASSYYPAHSDGSRRLYRYFNGHTGADVLAFTGVWAQLTARHPLCAAKAFWALNGGFLDPLNEARSVSTGMMAKDSPKYPTTLSIAHPESLAVLRQQLLAAEELYARLPGISLLCSIGVYVWLLWILWYLVRRTRGRGAAWLLLPAMATLATCLLSAGYAVGIRYALPLAFTTPYLLCLLGRAVLADARGDHGFAVAMATEGGLPSASDAMHTGAAGIPNGADGTRAPERSIHSDATADGNASSAMGTPVTADGATPMPPPPAPEAMR